MNYGQKNILGVLATRNENLDHKIEKRQAIKMDSTTTELPLTTPAGDDPVVENLVYVATNKAILYTTETPILRFRGNKSSEDVTYSLSKHALVAVDERIVENRIEKYRLIIKFITTDKPVRARNCQFSISDIVKILCSS